MRVARYGRELIKKKYIRKYERYIKIYERKIYKIVEVVIFSRKFFNENRTNRSRNSRKNGTEDITRSTKNRIFSQHGKFFAETRAIVRSTNTFKATTRLVYARSLTFFGRFHLKPLFWENSPRMEGHDLDQPGDWYPAVAARSRRYLVSTSIAKQPEREIRPVISVSLLLHPFLRRFSFTLLFFLLSRLPSLFNFHWKPRTTGHYPCRRRFQTRSRSKVVFQGPNLLTILCTFKCRQTSNALPEFPFTKRKVALRYESFDFDVR